MRRLVDASRVRIPVPVRSRPRWSRRIPTRIAHGIGHDYAWVFMDSIGNKAVNPKLAESAPYLQTRELQLSTEELRNSVSVLREQSRALERQNFERTFFELVRLHHDIIKDLDFRRDDVVTASGRDCFRVFCKRFRALHDEAVETDALQRIRTAYGAFHEKYGHEVGHYFRNLYRILRFVHESDATHKTHYTAILRAQLSSSELLLMCYGTLHDVGENLKPLAEAYALFDNLEPRLLFNYAVEVPLYDIAAWGGQSETVARWYQTVSSVKGT